MTELAAPHHISKSRRRFVTFGGALILAACLTLVKITLIALDITEPNADAWPDTLERLASSEPREPTMQLDESKFTPWPSTLPEPAAGPVDPATDGSEMPPMETAASPIDPAALTEGQIEALRLLTARSQELDERERLLDMRAELNGRTEERLGQQINQLTALKEQIDALMTELDEAEEQKLARLVKIYETMKPKAAAEIFNRLEIKVLLHVVERMKEAKSAVVLGKMNPAIAKRVTTELARRKDRPDPGNDGIGS